MLRTKINIDQIFYQNPKAYIYIYFKADNNTK